MKKKMFDNFSISKDKARILYDKALESYELLSNILSQEIKLIGADKFELLENIINTKDIILEDLTSINNFLKSNPEIQSYLTAKEMQKLISLENKIIKQLEHIKQKISIAIIVNQKMLEIITKSIVSSQSQEAGYNFQGKFKNNNKNIISSFGIYNFTV